MGQTLRVPLQALQPIAPDPESATLRVPIGDLRPDQNAPQGERPPTPGADFLSGFASTLNPVPAVKAMYEAGLTPDGRFDAQQAMKATGRGLAEAQIAQFQQAGEAFKAGRVSEAVGHFTAAVLPLIGPAAAHAGETIASGDVARGMGEAYGLVVPMAGTIAGRGNRAVVGRGPLRNPNAAEAAAVEFGQAHSIPVDAATATGNPAVRSIQWGADRTFGGSVVGRRAVQQQQHALTRVGGELADQVHPVPVVPEQAGAGVRTAVTNRVRAHAAAADEAYTRLRELEAKATPTTVQTGSKTVQTGVLDVSGNPISREVPVMQSARLAVDVKAARAALKPLYDRLKREAELAPLMGGKADALRALDRLMSGPDIAPLSVVDAALGDLKGMARADIPELRTQGQATAAEAVKRLEQQVMQTAAKAGGEVVAALHNGRRATIAKYQAIDVLEALADEPVRTFQGVVVKSDAAIDKLRDLQKQAPQEIPKLGRAYLEDLFSTATAEGGFGRTDSIWNKWQQLGPETKRVLFGAQTADLDKFFLLAKKAMVNPNPSGTAFQLMITGQGVQLFTNPLTGVGVQIGASALAKLLRNQRFVKALTHGMQLPVANMGNKAVAASAVSELVRIAGDAAVPIFRAAEGREETPPARGAR